MVSVALVTKVEWCAVACCVHDLCIQIYTECNASLKICAMLLDLCSIDATSQVALNALLERSREVLLQFTKDEALAGACPLPR